MEVVIVPDGKTMGELAASAIAELLTRKPHALVGVATGSTPMPVYDALVEQAKSGGLDASRCRICQLDEYAGLPTGHPQSYRTTVEQEVVQRLGLPATSFFGPDGSAEDLTAACADYERVLHEAGGVDLQLLGIGTDGHIGFNEPCSSLGSRTRIKTLTEQTRADNARFFGDEEVPRHVITQGIGTILEARHLILLANGASKAHAVALAVEGPLSAAVPASALQLHPHATVILDEAAASDLKLADYFRATYATKPAWQGL